MLTDIGLIAANTSRTRAYLAALERHSLLPAWTLLLDDNSKEIMPGQAAQSNRMTSQFPHQEKCWSEIEFDPSTPLQPLLERLSIPYSLAGSRNINAPHVIDLITQSAPSVLIYSGYGGSLLRHEILNCGKKFLHVHGGYLPDFKGSTTNYYSLLAEGTLGASALFLTDEIDSGPIISRRKFPPPQERKEIDHHYDSAARSRVLIETLKKYLTNQQWPTELTDNYSGSTYYIIHPVLKHLAILGNNATG